MRCRALPLKSTSRPKAATLHAFRRYLETSLGHQSQARARDMSSGVTSVVGVDCDVERQPCLSGRDSGHVRPGECTVSSHDGGWPWGPYPCRVARYRLDACTGVGALLIRSKPLSVLKARPPELKHSFTARVPPCRETVPQEWLWPRQPSSWFRTRASVWDGRETSNKTLHFHRAYLLSAPHLRVHHTSHLPQVAVVYAQS